MQVSKFKVLKVINETDGKIFAVRFTKKNGAIRTMLARLGVSKNLKRGSNGATDQNGLITVWDMVANGYRMINLETLISLNASGRTYEII